MHIFNPLVLILGLTVNAYCAQPEVMLWPHQGTMVTAASADGSVLALGGYDGNLRLFTFKGTAVSMRSLNCGNRVASALALTSDGGRLAATGGEGWIALFDTASARKMLEVPHGSAKPSKLVFSEDGKMLASVSGAEVMLLDASSGKRLGAFKTRGTTALALAKSRSWLKFAASKAEVRLFSAEQEKRLEQHGGIRKSWFSPGGRLMALGDGPELTRNADGKVLALPGLPGQYAQHIAFSGDGERMAVVREYGDVQAWDLKKGRLTAAFNWRVSRPRQSRPPQSHVTEAAFPNRV